MGAFVSLFHRLLALLACMSMVAAFVCVALGVVARKAGWDIPGLDAYAGYAIAAALFLALPYTFQRGEHIRVTLLFDRLRGGARTALELWCLVAGLALSSYMAFFAVRLAWMSHAMHDVSPAADATPLWIPQISMALGCIGFALAMAEALWARLRGMPLFHHASAGAAAHLE